MTGATFTATLLSNASALLPDHVSAFFKEVQTMAVTNGLPSWAPWAFASLIAVVTLYFEFCTSPVRITHAKETNPIAVYDKESGAVVKVPLDAFVKERCKKLVNGVFYPTFYLWNGHLQTVWASLTGSLRHNKVTYERMPDGGVISMDWCPKIDFNPENTTPIVVILHGLTGGSHESYVQDLVHEVVKKGFRAVVCNFRGCAETELKSAQLYSGAYTDDIRFATQFIQRKLPGASLIAVGFSLGANILTKVAL
ncbi:hypothetical protein HDU67_004362 [Dinochytrium kinnereticum]|nr:hypothetical protein HDU67_004362 [Dinochytrium kinnereticum]